MKAYLSEKLKNGAVKCLACAHGCIISPDGVGICSIRKNVEGELVLLAYGSAISAGIDQIEKKPLYHFLPSSLTFSFGTLGCNFKCGFCQNHEISMPRSFSFKKNLSPGDAVRLAKENDCKSIAYTYTEPAIFAEYAIDTAILAKKEGLKNVLVTNGFLSEDSLVAFSKVIDAVNIDLKSFSDDFYKKECKARLAPVLRAIEFFHKKNILVEITTLIIPQKNDSKKELSNIANFIASIDTSIPWHISRFFPSYKFKDFDVTPESVLLDAKSIGECAGLKFVYIGNLPFENITKCPNCSKSLIIRRGYETIINIENNRCSCGYILRGVF